VRHAGWQSAGRNSAAMLGAAREAACRSPPPSRTQTRWRAGTVLRFNMALSFIGRGNAAAPGGEAGAPRWVEDQSARLQADMKKGDGPEDPSPAPAAWGGLTVSLRVARLAAKRWLNTRSQAHFADCGSSVLPCGRDTSNEGGRRPGGRLAADQAWPQKRCPATTIPSLKRTPFRVDGAALGMAARASRKSFAFSWRAAPSRNGARLRVASGACRFTVDA
jgi:hypothetical protein